MYMKTIWQSIIYCIWQLNGDALSSSLSLVWEFKVLVIIQSRKCQISLLAVQHLTWGWGTRCLCGWDPWILDGLQPPTASSSNRWEGRFRLNIIAMCKGDLNSSGRLFLFKIHGGVMRGGPETQVALCLRLVTANCLAPEFQAEPSTCVFSVKYLSHDKAPWTGLQTTSLPWF